MQKETDKINVAPADKELVDYSYDDFKQRLVALHNDLVPDVKSDSFDGGKNYAGQFREEDPSIVEGIPVRYPHPKDKEELLRYALEKAKQCDDETYSAMLLSAAVVAVHPFHEGNGRVSRAIYTDMMGVNRVDESDRTAAGIHTIGTAGRDTIDMGTALHYDQLKVWLHQYPYMITGLGRADIRVGLWNRNYSEEKEQVVLRDDAREGLDPDEQNDVIDAIGADAFGNTYNNDMPSLMFAVKSMIAEYPKLETLLRNGSGFRVTSIHEFLPALTVEQKKDFVTKIWEYRKLLAKGTIDFLSDDFGGKQEVQRPSRPTQKMRDFVIEHTTNLHSSNIR